MTARPAARAAERPPPWRRGWPASAWTHLVGINPTRDRIPLGAHEEAWQGLSVVGPLARTVTDAALFLDATAVDPPEGGFLAAARTPPGPLKVAVHRKPLPGIIARLGADEARVLDETADALRALGHEVVEREIDLPLVAGMHAVARYLRGIADDVGAAMPHPERLERRTRGMARRGRMIPAGMMAKVRAQEPAIRGAVDDVLRDADVILMPGPADGPTRVGTYHGRSAAWTLNAVAPRHPYTGLFNATGHPSASVPMGFDSDGLPVGVQIAGPHGSEALLLSLSGQLEAERRWAERRPPIQ